MALQEFWISVRTASRLHAPQPIVDAPSLDAGTIQRKLRGPIFIQRNSGIPASRSNKVRAPEYYTGNCI